MAKHETRGPTLWGASARTAHGGRLYVTPPLTLAKEARASNASDVASYYKLVATRSATKASTALARWMLLHGVSSTC